MVSLFLKGDNLMNKKYLLFGSGTYGKMFLKFLGKENVYAFIDNNLEKQGTIVEDVPVCSLESIADRLNEFKVVIAVGPDFEADIISQVESVGIKDYLTGSELRKRIIKKSVSESANNIDVYNKAIAWIVKNTEHGKGIINSTQVPKSYPEVTGYYIPSLLRWGYRDLAIEYASWLCCIQKEDGSWYDTDDNDPYVFDTAQILKGLIAIRDIIPEVDENIKKGCDWILRNIQDNGRLATPTIEAWGRKGQCSELIHLYCLSPLIDATHIFDNIEYEKAAKKVLEYYKENYYEDIVGFNVLSHFYAYIVEALLDLGEIELARVAMNNVAMYQKANGAVPGYKDVDWICSTGLFQFALIWFKLGDLEHGEKAFEYACSLQNESGGWYGSYLSKDSEDEDNDYFPFGEISWANKYFLDALSAKNRANFESKSDTFLDSINKNNGLYLGIKEYVSKLNNNARILDVGCGKGRYLKNLIIDVPDKKYFAIDISDSVMGYISNQNIEKKQGTLTCIPYEDNYFDMVYACEALEHAVDIKSAVREMSRVVKPGGYIVIIDKNRANVGAIEIEKWEQWPDIEELQNIIDINCKEAKSVEILKGYDGDEKGIFTLWAGIK